MAVIRHLSVRNFRGIRSLDWSPGPGINALIGPGDMGKSSILEAIELAIGQGSAGVADTDFCELDVERDIVIEVTLGDLPDEILDLEGSLPLRGFNPGTHTGSRHRAEAGFTLSGTDQERRKWLATAEFDPKRTSCVTRS